MKKIAILLTLCLLAGCSGANDNTTTTVCSVEIEGLKTTNTLVANEDKIVSQKIENEMDYSAWELSEEDVKDAVETYKGLYDIDGVSYEYEIKDNILTEKISVNFEKADFDELKDVNLINTENENITYVSLEKTIESLEDYGFSCK